MKIQPPGVLGALVQGNRSVDGRSNRPYVNTKAFQVFVNDKFRKKNRPQEAMMAVYMVSQQDERNDGFYQPNRNVGGSICTK